MDRSRQEEGAGSAPDVSGGSPPSPATSWREAAAEAAEWISSPVWLFACDPSDRRPRLRAAARIASPQQARAAAAELAPGLAEVLRSGAPTTLRAPDGIAACEAGVRVFPLQRGECVLGVLAIGLPDGLSEPELRALVPIASAVLARLDALHAREELDALRRRTCGSEHLADDKSDEVLRLSEELFAQDIELLRSNEKLGKIEKLKNDFIEKMSRELRTPLNSIIESIIAVLAGENDALSEAGKQSLRGALDDGTAFLRTLQNILDLWRIKQAELPVEIQDVNVREVVEEAIFSIQDTLGDKDIAIEKRFVEPFPKIRTDLAKINQILFLLLDNAAKFTSEGKIEIEASVEAGQLRCRIADTGIGICPDDQQFIFDEFYQVDDLASTKYRGAGLGLALIRDLITLLDGEISVSSEVGRGTRVQFSLPVQAI